MTARARAAVALVLVVATGALARAARRADAAAPANLSVLPFAIGDWTGSDAGPLDEESERILAADAYLNRTYQWREAADPVGLYIAYYAQQRPGVSIHSPLHCLPGTGWEPLDVDTIAIPSDSAASVPQVRRMIVRKDLDRAIVLYWYAVHGRILANELSSKLWLLHDSLRLHRSDAALVRVVVPAGRDSTLDGAAERQAAAFVRALLPFLSNVWS
jgi:EpsI family protein